MQQTTSDYTVDCVKAEKGVFLLLGNMEPSTSYCGQCDQIGRFIELWAAINLPKSHSFLGNSCKGVKINQFSCEIIIGQLL